jgi:ABC-2 type transport system permease protein
MRRLWYVMWKELLELRQDPRLFGIIFMAPVIQLTMLGYAATTDVKNVPIVVVDQDGRRRAVSSCRDSTHRPTSPSSPRCRASAMWTRGSSAARRGWHWPFQPIITPASIAGRPVTVQVIADGTDSNSAGVAMGYAANLVGAFNQDLARERLLAAGQDVPPAAIDARIRVWFNPQLESRLFMIPGIVALLLLVITTNLSSMAVVREKELGTLEQLNVTPVTRWQLIVGKLVPYGAIGIIDVILVTTVAVTWFRIPLLGSPLLLFVTSCIYLLTTLGLGLFISTISNTQQQAMMTATFFVMTPMMYLSGFIFPIENMPAVIQPFTYLIPLRYFIIIVRGIFLKGVGWHVLWPQVAALLAWGIVIVALAVARSRKTLKLTAAGSRRRKITRRPASKSSAMSRMFGSRTSRSSA